MRAVLHLSAGLSEIPLGGHPCQSHGPLVLVTSVFLELHGSSEGQQLLHTISQERVTLKGQGWQLAYTSGGLGYIFKATESCYVAQLLKRSIYVEDDHAYMQGEQGKTYFDNCDVQVVPRYLKLQSPSGEAHVKMYEVSHFAHGCKVRGQVDIRKF